MEEAGLKKIVFRSGGKRKRRRGGEGVWVIVKSERERGLSSESDVFSSEGEVEAEIVDVVTAMVLGWIRSLFR